MLLHGGVSDHREWRRLMDAMEDDFTLLAWDAPGCGGSEDPPEDLGLRGFADALAGLIAEQGLQRPCIAGLSFGGGLALELYRRRPDLVGSLVLISAYAGWKGSLPPDVVRARLERAQAEARLPPEEITARWIAELFTGGPADEYVEILRDLRPAGLLAGARAFAEADLRDVLPTVRVPTLVVHGTADVRAPFAVAKALHDGIPASRLEVFEGVGHQVNMEAPERLAQSLRAFLRDH